jgi:hypothetical protein
VRPGPPSQLLAIFCSACIVASPSRCCKGPFIAIEQTHRPTSTSYRLRRLYGDRLGGFSETPCRDAWVCIASGVRLSFRPITGVGVLPRASLAKAARSDDVQCLPLLLVDLLMNLPYGSFRTERVFALAPDRSTPNSLRAGQQSVRLRSAG